MSTKIIRMSVWISSVTLSLARSLYLPTYMLAWFPVSSLKLPGTHPSIGFASFVHRRRRRRRC
jgi:hypothetical protein